MLSVTQTTDDVVIVDADGKLTRDDYRQFDRELSSLAENDRHMRVLIRANGLAGWTPAALWEDVKLDVAYRDVLDRVAIVGDRLWEEWLTRLSQPFVRADVRHRADVRYFDQSEATGAMGWLLEDAPDRGSA